METFVRIKFNKKFQVFEALTAAANKGKTLQKFGNDFNIYDKDEEICVQKAKEFLKNERLVFVK